MRAGRALGPIQQTYLRYDATGDMVVGRTVSGLPSCEPEFAILPPFFTKKNEIFKSAMKEHFYNIPKKY